MTLVIGTAGHIDHGKTSLLRALTGIDADRLPEERRRGLTIDLGYAHLTTGTGSSIDFVDVPGHDRLVGNMLVGAGEIDACLLVVAADDGPRAQTWEHLGLLDALGIEEGIAVVTKADAVEPGRVAEVMASTKALLASTRLAGRAVVAASARTGEGLDALRHELEALARRMGPAPTVRLRPARSWLAVDRVFSIRGRGTVVTGSARGAPIRTGGQLLAQPGGLRVRVRGVQVHDQDVEQGPEGGRVALNVPGGGSAGRAGPGEPPLRRGHVLASLSADPAPAPLSVSDRLLVVLLRPAHIPGREAQVTWPPPDGLEARLHIGTDQVDARLGRSGRDGLLLPGDRALALLRLDRGVATWSGQALVLRRPRPAALLGGGRVLDPTPPRGRSRRRQEEPQVRALISAVEDDDPDALHAALLGLHGLRETHDRVELAPDVEAHARGVAGDAVAAQHASHPELPGLPLAALRALVRDAIRGNVSSSEQQAAAAASAVLEALLSEGALERSGDQVHVHGRRLTPPDPARTGAMERLVAALDTPTPPSLAAATAQSGCPLEGLRELERAGRIVLVEDDLAWSRAAYDALSSTALALAAREPLTPAALRDVTGTSRKYVMALLADLDRRGILRRTPAGHVPGPRA